MYQDFNILAVIGARGGSKGLKNKNIINCAGKPLICWTIEAAQTSKYIDRIIVSTDDLKISEVAKNAGADVPFIRPHNLSGDDAPINSVIDHCIDWIYQNEKITYDYVLSLQPTSPLRTNHHIDEAVEYYFKNKKTLEDTLVAVVKAHEKMGWLMQSRDSTYIDFCFDVSCENPRRQSLPEYYMPNGALYLSRVQRNKKTVFYTKRTLFYVMDPIHSIDVDRQQDLESAVRYLELIHSKFS